MNPSVAAASERQACAHAEPIVIRAVEPQLDCGRYAVKREIGDWLIVRAEVLRDGQRRLDAALCFRGPGDAGWSECAFEPLGNDRWGGSFPLDRIGRWYYTIEAWTDRWGSWAHDVLARLDAGADARADMAEGAALLDAAIDRVAPCADRDLLVHARTTFGAATLADPNVSQAMRRHADRSRAARCRQPLPVTVDRERARFAAWYEFFPRSCADAPGAHGTFAQACRRLDAIAALGFDVVYVPPIHPIGRTNRKGRNNAATAAPGDVGSPWAIGGEAGGHTSVHPQLGSLRGFRRFVDAARGRGLEVAMDYALQCSPDHPWVREHPEWFAFRPDGSIRSAENPPKRYEDIVPFAFDSPRAVELWHALRGVLAFWIERGVKIFRVDNPHTKPIPFWEWLIAGVQTEHPEVIFLAEAFTRPKLMEELARIGFTQSYTYFTWRTTKSELTEYATELAMRTNEFLRPNFFVNTPDILSRFLQDGGRPAFRIRLILAATLSSLYGMYSGFELCEREAIAGTEEYRDAEKYEIRVRDWEAPGNILPDIRAINRIRRENPALHEFENLRFYPSNDDAVLFYGKVDFHHRNAVFVAVNLDPHAVHRALLEFPTGEFGIDPGGLADALAATPLTWREGRAEVVLDPQRNPAAVYVYDR